MATNYTYYNTPHQKNYTREKCWETSVFEHNSKRINWNSWTLN